MILNSEIDCVEIPVCHTAVYGFSYHTKEVYSKAYVHAYAGHRQKYEILLIHGGDEKHLPIQKEEIKKLGYDYIALGHIHKPQEILPGQMAYPGALEPIDKNDIGTHGYMKGEITEKGCKTVFVPAARREYKHLQVEVSRQMTGYALKEKIKSSIEEQGTQNIYKILLNGYRDPDILFDKTGLDVYGNVIEITDHTRPAYDFEKLYGQNRENILGALIEAFRGCSEESTEYQALCEGVHALMETRRN